MVSENNCLSFDNFVKTLVEEAEQALKDPYVFKNQIENIAVIGAGPCGLVSAKHLADAGLKVKVFERNSTVGGVWVYSDRARPKPKMPSNRVTREIDPEALGLKAGERQKRTYELTPEMNNFLLKKCPPSACYRDLHNNIATKLFALDYHPFPEGTPLWCPHETTLNYFESYADKFGLKELIEFNTNVDLVTKKKDTETGCDKWEVTLCKYIVDSENGKIEIIRWKESFDAIVAASGVYQDPYIPDFKDFNAYNKLFPSRVSHSVQYRQPEVYKNKVNHLGGSISAVDIVRALDGFANSISMSIRGPLVTAIPIINLVRSKIPACVNIKPSIAAFANLNDEVDGSIQFVDGTSLSDIDYVIFCTGYINRLSYFANHIMEVQSTETTGQLFLSDTVSSKEVPESHIVMGPKCPLNTYRDVFLIDDPTVAFVGMTAFFSTIWHYDAQALAVARVWGGQALLPSYSLMQKFTAEADFTPATDSNGWNDGDRRRRETFVTWLNHHAVNQIKSKGTKCQPLPIVNNYPENYELLGKETAQLWLTVSEENLQKSKDKIRQEGGETFKH
ncbi:hypothetical protein BDF20DRAFT_827345 [Mycotypha africana]|uniref:uncharacterized protein n=1 Tax=Mycotypha africana TaxID=64632 RepID=UPI0023015401|nr:uncharacterized protein BDF20DRAFT_827345 [Mycotypha africana]KAI8968965.1 hypothetical protein BDF20DRAFT_827345 [Mycotypha africana]